MIFRDPPKGQRPINAFFKPEEGGQGGGGQGSGGRVVCGGGGGKWGPGRGKAPRG